MLSLLDMSYMETVLLLLLHLENLYIDNLANGTHKYLLASLFLHYLFLSLAHLPFSENNLYFLHFPFIISLSVGSTYSNEERG